MPNIYFWMSNISCWKKLTFSKLRFSRKESLKKCTSFEEKKGGRYIRENVYFGIIVFNCLTRRCLRFLLMFLACEIKDVYQSFWRNEVAFTDIMNVFQNILAKKKLRDNLVNERAMITATLISSDHRKTLISFCFRKKKT